MFTFTTPPIVPFMTIPQYLEHSGLARRTFDDMVAAGKIIMKKKDKPKEKPMVNMFAMNEIAAREAVEFLG